jgi:hypothetical protein
MTISPDEPGPARERDIALEQESIPAGGAFALALPRRHIPASPQAGVRAPKWLPADPEILARVRAALARL